MRTKPASARPPGVGSSRLPGRAGWWGRTGAAGGVRLVATLWLASASVGCSDTVTSRFSDLQQAQDERAFERGWLPPILPPSTKGITEKNNLDLNIGEGTFTFSPGDRDYFVDHGAEPVEITPASRSPQRRLQDEGFRFLRFSKDATSWLIAVHPDGRGAYWVRSRR